MLRLISLVFTVIAAALFDYALDLTAMQGIGFMIGLVFALAAWELLDYR